MIARDFLLDLAAALEERDGYIKGHFGSVGLLDSKKLLALATRMDRLGMDEVPFLGPLGTGRLKELDGQKVVLSKGTKIGGVLPPSLRDGKDESGRNYKVYKRSVTITVRNVDCGWIEQDWDHKPGVVEGLRVHEPSLMFWGPGSYNCSVTAAQVPNAVSLATPLLPMTIGIMKNGAPDETLTEADFATAPAP